MDQTRLNTVKINDCSIEYNALDNGTTSNFNFAEDLYLRGITSLHSALTKTKTTFNNNDATGRAYGAGVLYSMQSNYITIDNCTFNNNTGRDGSASGLGYHNLSGGIGFFRFNDIKVTNSTFTANSAETSGGAIFSYYNHITIIFILQTILLFGIQLLQHRERVREYM